MHHWSILSPARPNPLKHIQTEHDAWVISGVIWEAGMCSHWALKTTCGCDAKEGNMSLSHFHLAGFRLTYRMNAVMKKWETRSNCLFRPVLFHWWLSPVGPTGVFKCHPTLGLTFHFTQIKPLSQTVFLQDISESAALNCATKDLWLPDTQNVTNDSGTYLCLICVWTG